MSDHSSKMVICSVPSKDSESLAESIVKKRYGACVQVIKGITSFYWWEGKVCKDQEELLFIKTHSEKVLDLIEFIKSNHPYTVPEILTLEVKEELSNQDYISWLKEELRVSEKK